MKEPPESPTTESALQDKKNYASKGEEKTSISANNSNVDSTTISDEKQKRIAKLAHFFNQLYGKIPEPHFAYLFTKHGIFPFVINEESQRIAMAIKAVELSSSGVDVWHSVNTVSVQPSNGKRGDETVVSFQTAIVTDIDIAGTAHKSTNLAVNFDQAKSFLPIKPSILLDSGHGAQAYFIFDQPILTLAIYLELCALLTLSITNSARIMPLSVTLSKIPACSFLPNKLTRN